MGKVSKDSILMNYFASKFKLLNFDEEYTSVNSLNELIKKRINELKTMSPTEDIALVCYEKPGDFCHRHLVAKWLTDNGFTCEEYTYGG